MGNEYKIRLAKAAQELKTSRTKVLEYLRREGFKLDDNPDPILSVTMYDLLAKKFASDKSAETRNFKLKPKIFIEKNLNSEEFIERDVKNKILEDALLFKFDSELISILLTSNNIENKQTFRRVLREAASSINSQYRSIFYFGELNYMPSINKIFKGEYLLLVNDLWKIRYSEKFFYLIVSSIFQKYLDSCYQIFHSLLIKEKNNQNTMYDESFSRENVYDELSNILSNKVFRMVWENENIPMNSESKDTDKTDFFIDTDNLENEKKDYYSDGYYCTSCQEKPCMCSDPEKSSSLF
jgi:hypothetical protein